MSGVILLIETFFAERCLATVNLKAPRTGLPTVAQIPLLQTGSLHLQKVYYVKESYRYKYIQIFAKY